jgi:CRISPR/Cas system-associated exonuclease Cas4 (RecB family)
MIELTEKQPTPALPEAKQLEALIDEAIQKKIRVYPRNSLWASQLDHPCVRENEYGLTRWQDQKLTPGWLQEIFEEGRIHEDAIIEKLKDAGFKIRQSQRPLFEKVRVNGTEYKYGISGRLDFEITHEALGGIWYPVEAKSMEPFAWDSINSVEDMKNHKRYYLRMYIGQIQMYLYASSREHGLMVLKNKVSGRLKFIWITLDLDVVERMLKKAEQINEAVAKAQADPQKAEELLSPRIEYDEQICGRCAFAHICLPDQQFGDQEIDLDSETEAKLRRREELKTAKDEFEDLDEEVKAGFKKRGKGKYLVAASFNVDVSEVSTTKYDVPKELKEQYASSSSYLKVSIKALKPTDGNAEEKKAEQSAVEVPMVNKDFLKKSHRR